MDTANILMILGAALAAGIILYFLFKSLFRHMARGISRLGDDLIRKFFHGLASIQTHDEEKPRSLPNMESLILPQVMRDFPDFDLAMAKNAVRDHLQSLYGARSMFMIHNVVLTEYRTRTLRKALIFNAAVCWRRTTDNKLVQKKLEISMEFMDIKGDHSRAVLCPNCGATLGFGDLECQYCGTRINDSREQEWAFPSVRELL